MAIPQHSHKEEFPCNNPNNNPLGKVKVRWVSLSDEAAKTLGSDQPGLTVLGNKGELDHEPSV